MAIPKTLLQSASQIRGEQRFSSGTELYV
jgi:hypothetical protein